MQEFLLGSIGAMAVIAIYALGVFSGWKAHKKFCRATAKPLEEKEMRRLEQEQEAFRQLQNYSSEQAYGMGRNGGNED